MGSPQPVHRMTRTEFAAWEHGQEKKYEFVNGEVFEMYAMGGARREHNAVAINVATT